MSDGIVMLRSWHGLGFYFISSPFLDGWIGDRWIAWIRRSHGYAELVAVTVLRSLPSPFLFFLLLSLYAQDLTHSLVC